MDTPNSQVVTTSVKLLCQDDCAPDSLESFEHDFPTKSGGLTLAEFTERATREDYDGYGNPCDPFDSFTVEWRLGDLVLSVSADDPYYELAREQ